jgi:polynucleotide 5'-kinase involved in rRNA processing
LTRTLRDRHTRYRHNENENHYRMSGGPVRIAFVGKGGSGKTTLSSMFVRHLAAQGLPVAIDANINQHLGEALGADSDPLAMGAPSR